MDSLDILDILREAVDYAFEELQISTNEYNAAATWINRQADAI